MCLLSAQEINILRTRPSEQQWLKAAIRDYQVNGLPRSVTVIAINY